MSEWHLDELKPCKIGTVPHLVRVHGKDWKRLAAGKWIRVQFAENGNWEQVFVTRVDDGIQAGYFMADR